MKDPRKKNAEIPFEKFRVSMITNAQSIVGGSNTVDSQTSDTIVPLSLIHI